MGEVVSDLSISLDGFIAGADDGAEHPLGIGGEALFAWMNAGPEKNRIHEYITAPDASQPVIDDWQANSGAIISGRRTFDIAGGWKHGHPFDVPIFVVTHEAPTSGEWSPRVSFVTDGVESALTQAQAAAGDKSIGVAGAAVAQELLRLKKLTGIQVSVAPVLLGSGVRLLEHFGKDPIQLEQVRVVPSDQVTHLRYNVIYG